MLGWGGLESKNVTFLLQLLLAVQIGSLGWAQQPVSAFRAAVTQSSECVWLLGHVLLHQDNLRNTIQEIALLESWSFLLHPLQA